MLFEVFYWLIIMFRTIYALWSILLANYYVSEKGPEFSWSHHNPPTSFEILYVFYNYYILCHVSLVICQKLFSGVLPLEIYVKFFMHVSVFIWIFKINLPELGPGRCAKNVECYEILYAFYNYSYGFTCFIGYLPIIVF